MPTAVVAAFYGLTRSSGVASHKCPQLRCVRRKNNQVTYHAGTNVTNRVNACRCGSNVVVWGLRTRPTLPAGYKSCMVNHMYLLPGISTTVLIGLLPLTVLMLLCAGGYLIVKRGRTDVVDSPWFWAFAFSAFGLLGVWAISGKYDDRQKRLESRYEARERIAAQQLRDDAIEQDSPAIQPGYSQERQVPLRYLAAGLMLVSLTSAVMLWRNQRQRNHREDLPGG